MPMRLSYPGRAGRGERREAFGRSEQRQRTWHLPRLEGDDLLPLVDEGDDDDRAEATASPVAGRSVSEAGSIKAVSLSA